jgi:hypothetical protein
MHMAGSFEHSNEPLSSIKCRKILELAEKLVAVQGLSFIDLVSQLGWSNVEGMCGVCTPLFYVFRMTSGGLAQSWYPSSQTTIPVSAPQHAPEHTQAPQLNLQEQAAVQPNNNINVAGTTGFTSSC